MYNKVIIMGRLTADPELRQTNSGIATCRFTVAVDRPYQKDKEKQADFIRCTAWRNTAEFISKYFAKGKAIIVDGSLRNNDYEDKNGTKHYSMDVLVDNVSFGESKGASGQESSDRPAQRQQPQAQQTAQISDLNEFEEILADGEVPF